MVTNPIASIIIPVASYHLDLAQRAVNSAEAQTRRAEIIVVEDKDGRGAAWARNKGLEKASAPFTVFLDADDEIQTEFVEQTVLQWLQCKHDLCYVYTDWRIGDSETIRYHEGGNFFELGMYHIISTLLPTEAARWVNGMDTTLPTLEDEDFYFKIARLGFCGLRLPEALVTYRASDGHSASNPTKQNQALIKQAHKIFWERYGSLRDVGCNCGNNKAVQPTTLAGQYIEGYVIAAANYTPTMKLGPVTNKKYDRVGHGQRIWVDPRDAAMRPDWWQVLADPRQVNPDVNKVMELMNT